MKNIFTILTLTLLLSVTSFAQDVVYLRTGTSGNYWGLNGNATTLDNTFGTGNWTRMNFEGLNVPLLLSSSVKFIFIDGSNSGTCEMIAFLNSYRTELETWVANGNSLFLNAAPNECYVSINMITGVTLELGPSSYGYPVDVNHPVFMGPKTPALANIYTGSSFSHSFILGSGLLNILIDSNSRPILAEKDYGSGKIMFGGITLEFIGDHPSWTPNPQISNLYSNILHYMYNNVNSCPEDITVDNDLGECGAIVEYDTPSGIQTSGLPSGSVFPVGTTTNTFDSGCSFTVTVNDNEEPTAIAQNLTVQLDANGNASILVNGTYSIGAPSGTLPVQNSASVVTNQTFNCPSGYVAVGYEGFAGCITDNFRLICKQLNPDGTLGATTAVTGFSGGGITTPFTTSLTGDKVLVGFNITDVDYLYAGTRIHSGVQGIGKSLSEIASGSANNTNTTSLPGLNGWGCYSSNPATTTQYAPDGYAIVGMEVKTTGYSSAVKFKYAPISYVAGLNNGSTDNCEIATVVASQTQFTCADLGDNTVTLTVTDLSGNTASTTATVTVQDIIVPTIECPADITVNNDPGVCGAVVTFNVSSTDNCSGVAVVSSPASGSVFPTGTTTVTSVATDASGNTATCSFTVTVNDTEAPIIVCPDNITVNNDPGVCGAVLDYDQPTATDNCSSVDLPTSIPGYTYQGTVGGHTYFISNSTATPEAANAAAIALGGHLVTIGSAAENAFVSAMNPNPIWIGFTDSETEGVWKWVNNELVSYTNWYAGEPNNYWVGEDWAVVNWVGSTWNDWYSTVPNFYAVEFEAGTVPTTLVAGGASGSEFPVGTTEVTYQAEDASGNVIECSFTVTVNDTEAPTIECRGDVTVSNDAGQCSAIVGGLKILNYGDNCPINDLVAQTSYTVTGASNFSGNGYNADGSSFNVGTSVLTYTITDNAGNTNSCSMNVIVEDTESPKIECRGDVTVSNDAGLCSAVVATGLKILNWGDNCPINNLTAQTSYTVTGASNFSGNGYNADGSSFNVGTSVLTYTITDNAGNTNSCSMNVIVNDTEAPSVTCPTPALSYNTDAGECNRSLTFAATATDNCGVEGYTYFVGENLITFPYDFPVGTTTVTAVATDIHGNTDECDFDVVVDHITTTLEVVVNTSSAQYSDEVTLTATLTPWDCDADCDAAGTVTFKIGNQVMGIEDIENGVATLTTQLCGDFNSTNTLGVFDVSAVFTPDEETCDIFLGSEDVCQGCLSITPEYACADYSGVLVASTPNISSNKFVVVLAATVKELNADGKYCDIRKAKVNFYADGKLLNSSPLPVGLVDVNDLSVGTASFEWASTVPTVGYATYQITIEVVGSYYSGSDCSGPTPVTVSKPMGEFITGGGYLILTSNTKGEKAGDVGSKNNFGFNVKWNKSITNLQGNINTIIRRTEADGYVHNWQVKGNVMSSLTVNATLKEATFTGKASISDVTDPTGKPGIVIGTGDGNATLQVIMKDVAEPGKDLDLIGITVWNKAGGVWFTSNWNGTKTVWQTIAKGNLQVQPSALKSGEIETVEITTAIGPEVGLSELKAYPNPFSDKLFFEFSREEDSKATLILFDGVGRKISVLFDQQIEANQNYRIEYVPNGLSTNMLFYRMIFDNEVINGKVIYKK